MLGIDTKIPAPMPMAGQNMIRLIERNTRPHGVVNKPKRKSGKEQRRQDEE